MVTALWLVVLMKHGYSTMVSGANETWLGYSTVVSGANETWLQHCG